MRGKQPRKWGIGRYRDVGACVDAGVGRASPATARRVTSPAVRCGATVGGGGVRAVGWRALPALRGVGGEGGHCPPWRGAWRFSAVRCGATGGWWWRACHGVAGVARPTGAGVGRALPAMAGRVAFFRGSVRCDGWVVVVACVPWGGGRCPPYGCGGRAGIARHGAASGQNAWFCGYSAVKSLSHRKLVKDTVMEMSSASTKCQQPTGRNRISPGCKVQSSIRTSRMRG